MEKRGQGALEYLLLIGGAVLIAVIVIAVITGLAGNTGNQVSAGAKCASYQGYDVCTGDTACKAVDSAGVRTADPAKFAVCRAA